MHISTRNAHDSVHIELRLKGLRGVTNQKQRIVKKQDKRGDYLGVEYRLTKNQVEQLNAELGIRIIDPLDFYFAYRHNLLDDVRIETVYGLDYRHQCWEISLRLHDINRSPDGLRDNELKVMVFITLSGIGRYKRQRTHLHLHTLA